MCVCFTIIICFFLFCLTVEGMMINYLKAKLHKAKLDKDRGAPFDQ